VEEILPNNLCQHPLVGNTRNVTKKVADSGRPEVKAVVQAAYSAPDRRVANLTAANVLNTHRARYAWLKPGISCRRGGMSQAASRCTNGPISFCVPSGGSPS
jgi:hypothetical protein